MLVSRHLPTLPGLLPLALLCGALHGTPALAGLTDLVPWPAKAQTPVDTARAVAAGAAAPSPGGLVLQGTVQLPPRLSEVASTPLAGVVQSLLAAPLDTVRAGQPLARIVSPALAQMQREWLTAETEARQAQARLARDEQLLAEGIIAEQRRNEARAQAQMASLQARERRQALHLAGLGDAALAQAEASQALSPAFTVVSPAAGTVLELQASAGQRLEAGAPIARVGRTGQLLLELQATATQAASLRVGDRFVVDGCKSPARLTAIAPQVNTGSQSVLLRAELANPGDCVRVNQYVQARHEGNAPAAGSAGVGVPAAALVQHAGQTWVFVREAKGWRPTVVQPDGNGIGGSVRVRGLSAGAEVAVRGLVALKGAWLGLGSEAEKP